jgi:hypothetical protein
MLTRIIVKGTYSATKAEWQDIAKALDSEGQTRLARAIRNGIERQTRKQEWWFGLSDVPDVVYALRFVNGSVAKLDRFIEADHA